MTNNDKNKYCPCCGYDTFNPSERFEYSICPICFWEDDKTQFDDPELSDGANRVSLVQAQMNFKEFGACERDMIKTTRKPAQEDKRNPDWEIAQKIDFKFRLNGEIKTCSSMRYSNKILKFLNNEKSE